MDDSGAQMNVRGARMDHTGAMLVLAVPCTLAHGSYQIAPGAHKGGARPSCDTSHGDDGILTSKEVLAVEDRNSSAQAIREARHTPENEMKMGTAYVWQTSVVDGHTQPPSRSPSNPQEYASWPVEEVGHGGLGASLFDLEAYADSVIDLEAYADSL